MTFFEKELKRIFGESENLTNIRYTGNVMIGRLTNETIAKLQFVTTGVSGNYNAVSLKIINPQSGQIDAHLFRFGDFFNKGTHIWDDCGEFGWYGEKPGAAGINPLKNAVDDYLEMFREPVQGMQMGM